MKEKILITVKTYPTLSRTYAELVCTAGLAHNNQISLALFQPAEIIDFSGKYNIMLILGTTEDAHRRKLPEQFIIIGVVPLPVNLQSAFSL